MSRAERSLNIKGAFEVNPPELIAGKNILLVDAELTTGATENEAAKMVPGGLMCLHSAEWILEKGLVFKAGTFFLQAEIRRSKEFCSA